MAQPVLVVHVYVHVKQEHVEPFIVATRANAAQSAREPGILRFDLAQEAADPTRFVLVEVYRDEAAAAAHKETAHYLAWRGAVAEMMAEPRTSRRFVDLTPGPAPR